MEEGQGMRNRREGKEGQRKGWRKGLVRRGRRRGALPWPGVCLSIFHSPAPRREAQLCSVAGPNTI